MNLDPPAHTATHRRAQNRLALNAKLKGQSLGAAGPAGVDDVDTLAWIKKSKKKAKELAKQMEEARKREAEQEERDREAYGEGGHVGLAREWN